MTNSEKQSDFKFTIIIFAILLFTIFISLYVRRAKELPWIPSFLFGTTAALMTYHWMDNASQKDNRFAGKLGPFDFQTTGALASLLTASVISNIILERQTREIEITYNTDPSAGQDEKGFVILNNKAEKVNLKIKASDSVTQDILEIIPQRTDLSSVTDNCRKGNGICVSKSFPVTISINESLPKGYARLCNDMQEFDLKEFVVSLDSYPEKLFSVVAIASKNCRNIQGTTFIEISSNQDISIQNESKGNLRELTIPSYKDSEETQSIRNLP